ncbi:MAG: cell division cycle 123 family protein [Candidatus Thiosymbion ectosymbiont of Robbea hypermnestra]|nr:cell division cycle 123 family protein [Candidatus Thiosymbion ectosymbiont of Robbea hypermnestra]
MTDNPFRRAEPTFLEHWSEGMTALAPAAVSAVLTLREARALGSVQSVWGQWFGPPDRQGLASLRAKLAQLFRSKPSGGAIRLGSRSPKDADLALSQGLFADRTECAFQLLTDGSKRLAWDLREAIAHNHRPSLYLRTWIPHAAWEEIRLFFFNRSCTGGSAPVYASIPDDYPVHALARRVSEFARRLGRTLSLPHCIAEVLAPHAGDEVFLLDINPFHPSTDAALYAWTLERLRHGHFGGLLKYRSGNRVRAIPLADREARSYSGG